MGLLHFANLKVLNVCILHAATRLTACILLIHSVLSQHERGKNFLFWWSGSLRVE